MQTEPRWCKIHRARNYRKTNSARSRWLNIKCRRLPWPSDTTFFFLTFAGVFTAVSFCHRSGSRGSETDGTFPRGRRCFRGQADDGADPFRDFIPSRRVGLQKTFLRETPATRSETRLRGTVSESPSAADSVVFRVVRNPCRFKHVRVSSQCERHRNESRP